MSVSFVVARCCGLDGWPWRVVWTKYYRDMISSSQTLMSSVLRHEVVLEAAEHT